MKVVTVRSRCIGSSAHKSLAYCSSCKQESSETIRTVCYIGSSFVRPRVFLFHLLHTALQKLHVVINGDTRYYQV